MPFYLIVYMSNLFQPIVNGLRGSKLKSKLDWESFTEQHGIKEELKQHGKNGCVTFVANPILFFFVCLFGRLGALIYCIWLIQSGIWKRWNFCSAPTNDCMKWSWMSKANSLTNGAELADCQVSLQETLLNMDIIFLYH